MQYGLKVSVILLKARKVFSALPLHNYLFVSTITLYLFALKCLVSIKIDVMFAILVSKTDKPHKSVLSNVCVARSRHASKDGAHAQAIKLSPSHLVLASTAFFVLNTTSCLSLNGDNSICVMVCHSHCPIEV